MSIRSKGLVFAMEEGEVVDEVSKVELTEVADATAEVAEQGGEVDDHVEALSDGVDNIEEMTSVQDVLQKSVDSGEGVSEDAAEIAEIAVEAICARLGIKKQRTVPSLEAFGSKSSRLVATKFAIESIGEKIDQAWKAVKAFFAKVWAQIKAFFKTVWGYIVSFKNTAKGLLTRVSNATFKSQEYVIPSNMTVQEYAEAVKAGLSEGADAAAALADYKKNLDAIAKAAAAGNTEEAEKLMAAGKETLGIATESKTSQQQKTAAKKVDETIRAKAEESRKLSESEARSMAKEVVTEAAAAADGIAGQNKIDGELDAVEQSVNKLVDTAQAEVKAASAVVEKNESPEKVAEAKAKISLWTKVKTYVSKAFSFVGSFVTGVFRRAVSLVKYGFYWVTSMLKAAVATAVVTGKDLYHIGVKGEKF